MPILTDRQRIELAVPACLLYSLASAEGVFVPAGPALKTQAATDVAGLRENLRVACLEPFADLTPTKKQALLRRLNRIKQQVSYDWHERPALGVMLMLWCFLKDLGCGLDQHQKAMTAARARAEA
uniref:hypothetical protein n=1 Tax=Methylobacterium oryzae TaxID=334852 RepID=UPI00155DA6BC|nr:hypothetical protein [Methylobacterium oryzae]